MKKLLLLLAAGTVAMNVGAQERQLGVVGIMDVNNKPVAVRKNDASGLVRQNMNNRNSGGAAKTTAVTERWYNYADFLDTISNYNASFGGGTLPNSMSSTALYLWNDTASEDVYTGGTTSHNTMVSVGTVLDPTMNAFNDGAFYDPSGTTLAIGSGDAYAVDSIIVVGAYGTNAARMAAGVVDTLIVSVVHGNGASRTAAADVYADNGLSGTHWGSPNWFDVQYDSTGKNCAHGGYASGSPAFYTARIPMTSPSSSYGNDTLKLGDPIMYHDGDFVGVGSYYKRIGFPAISCAAGDKVGVTVSFKSGDASFTFGSVVFNSSNTYNFNMLRPLIAFQGTSTAAAWPIYTASDYNVGLFKTLPDTAKGWGHQYIPEWAWSSASGSAAAESQTPYIWTHLVCASCTGVVTNAFLGVNTIAKVNSVLAYPNPAVEVLNISYELSQASDITVSLTNMLGQVVDSRKLTSAIIGKVEFNTSNLADGIYIYTVSGNGIRSTGNVAVSH